VRVRATCGGRGERDGSCSGGVDFQSLGSWVSCHDGRLFPLRRWAEKRVCLGSERSKCRFLFYFVFPLSCSELPGPDPVMPCHGEISCVRAEGRVVWCLQPYCAACAIIHSHLVTVALYLLRRMGNAACMPLRTYQSITVEAGIGHGCPGCVSRWVRVCRVDAGVSSC